MKARRVKGLEPDMRLDDAAERMVCVRVAELAELAVRALEPDAVEALHDTRIAAKRLRYLLEITAPVLGPYAETAGKRCKEVQDLLGEVHDCDVMLPRLDALRQEVRAVDAVVLAMDGQDPPHADAYRGLERLAVELTARRRTLFSQWLVLWTDLERKGFRARLEHAAGERPREPVDDLLQS
jgi:CHAD domain-containing protein